MEKFVPSITLPMQVIVERHMFFNQMKEMEVLFNPESMANLHEQELIEMKNIIDYVLTIQRKG